MRYRQWLGIFIAAAFMVAGTSSTSAKKLLADIELYWKPTTSIPANSIDVGKLRGKKLQIGIFSDGRADKKRIAENREDADEGTILPVTTTTDIPAWVGNHVADQLQQIGFTTVTNGGDYILDGSVEQFFVVETDKYNATVSIHLKLSDKAGTTLWETTMNAHEARAGRSYKLENYAELLSDAVVNIVRGIAAAPDFRNALQQN